VQWRCLEGGSKMLIDAMVAQLKTKPSYGHQVTAVKLVYKKLSESFPNLPGRYQFPLMKVSIAGKGDEYFAHVISTSTFANLSTIDTERVPMTYKQRQAIRTLNYGPAVKVGIRFKTRWWEQDGLTQRGGSSYTDRPSRTIVYPSAGLGEAGPGVLMATYNWCVLSCSNICLFRANRLFQSGRHQDANRFGALIEKSDWSKQLDPNRKRPWSEEILLDQLYSDLSTLHGVSVKKLREDTLDYHAFNWYHNPFTKGAYAHFAPGQFSTFFKDILLPAAYGRFHFAGEVASAHHAWVAGALDSAVRVVDEIICWDLPILIPKFRKEFGRSVVFSDEKSADEQFVRGVFSQELEEAGAY
jgi:monoamine oxidase